ncbi:HAD family hydrolase [Campylobacter sp. US33a]|uniref:phosphoglycolate phosphatase n=1 Tax=Campylobacter sp. CCS1377 TaxID=3158229 RepID=A0AAU7E8N9_9BACT|nr:HAD family hydrolase [Campylobacter sp. US33a]TEY01995.1 HAD family hydrolase [Campylobacter sp. US33a]
MQKKTILFDLDGTLIDSTPAILNSCKNAFEKLDLTPALDEDIKALIGYPLDEMFIKLYGNKKELAQNFIEFYREKYHTIYLEQTTLLARVKEALNLASKFADLGIVTTKGSQFTKPLLDFLGIGNFFQVIIGRNDVVYPKPHKEPIEKALLQLNKPKDNAFMIGDTKLDILAAKNANINAVAVSCGYEKKESLLLETSFVKQDAYDAVLFIKSL